MLPEAAAAAAAARAAETERHANVSRTSSSAPGHDSERPVAIGEDLPTPFYVPTVPVRGFRPRGPGARRARFAPVALGPTAAAAAAPPDTIYQGTVVDFGHKMGSKRRCYGFIRVDHTQKEVWVSERGRAKWFSVGRG